MGRPWERATLSSILTLEGPTSGLGGRPALWVFLFDASNASHLMLSASLPILFCPLLYFAQAAPPGPVGPTLQSKLWLSAILLSFRVLWAPSDKDLPLLLLCRLLVCSPTMYPGRQLPPMVPIGRAFLWYFLSPCVLCSGDKHRQSCSRWSFNSPPTNNPG